MVEINTNVYALSSQNFTRLNQLNYNERIERLSNGLRINRGADDPSGLAISQGMYGQLRGISTAIGNAQETIYMLQLVDHFVGDIWDVLARMRDLSLRLGNQATLNYTQGSNPADLRFSDCTMLHREIELLKDHIYKSFVYVDDLSGNPIMPRFNFNHKSFFSSGSSGFLWGLPAQVGPDNTDSHRIDIFIDDMNTYFNDFSTPYNPPPPPGNVYISWYTTYAQKMIDLVDDKMTGIAELRVSMGTQINRLRATIDDLNTQYNWVSKSRSQIVDADMAEEIANLTRNLITQQTTNIAYSQANAVPLITLQLLSGIYSGLNEKMVGQTTISSLG